MLVRACNSLSLRLVREREKERMREREREEYIVNDVDATKSSS